MTGADPTRQEEALDWARRIHDPTFADWDAHIAWLEADPRNTDAFDTALIVIEDACAGLGPARMPKHELPAVRDAINDNSPVAGQRRASRWGLGIGGAIAAGFAAVLAVPALMHGGAQPYRIETTPGTPRDIALADGTTIALNGGSILELDHADPRIATLVSGEAFFHVVHDAAHPFAVRAGDGVFQDVGTSFDMVRDAGGVRVAVREGAVMYDPKGAAVRLEGGQQIALDTAGATIRQIDPAAVGSWRQGRLSYRDATLGEIAADLSRSIGSPVMADATIKDRRFSGVLMIDGDRDRMFRRIASVIDVRIRHVGNGWQMTPLDK
ncbi:FecR family protein [Sphingomonas oryzagri]|uniref:FecR domain-containing protein n=1 Tax=Sphingomonas oryzagri TaxID=3042314 RepID=A0ABT6N5Q7_9SPHN|nr:FecR domain-containing protein [Sphingomonas oryzagri]MDH7640440.1 FecR domain-containing protein [Sphingomonas oryzagri]